VTLRPDTEELEEMPTITEAQADDLKIDTGTERYWLSRGDTLDGEPFENTVTIEELRAGRWEEVERYDGDDPEGPRLYPSESSGTGWNLEDD